MKKLLLFLALLGLCATVSSYSNLNLVEQAAMTATKMDSFYLGGIQVNEPDKKKWADVLKNAKMNTVEVTVYARQGDWDSDSLSFPQSDENILHEIRSAKAAGLKVVLILRITLDHAFDRNRFLWHGMIFPKDSIRMNRWFERYALFVDSWAQIAQAEGVEVLGIGSEMNALSSTIPIQTMPKLYAHYNSIVAQKQWEQRNLKFKKQLQTEDLWVRGYDNYPNLRSYIRDRIKAHHYWSQQVTLATAPNRIALMNKRRKEVSNHWRKIIKNTRKIFDGQLTYAANFDNYMMVDFWNELDFIGINAYFPLRNANKDYNNDETLRAGLVDGWQKVFKQINRFRSRYDCLDKPIIFTELGYIFRENTTIAPWEGFGFMVVGTGSKQRLVIWNKEKINHTERALAIDALHEVVQAQNINLQGILYWKLTSIESHSAIEPFVLVLSPESKDPLQTSLANFIQN